MCGHSPKEAIDSPQGMCAANSTLQNQTVGGLHLPAKFLPKLTPSKNKIKQDSKLGGTCGARNLSSEWINSSQTSLNHGLQRDLVKHAWVLPNDEAQKPDHVKSSTP